MSIISLNMNQFYSSLVISSKKFPTVHQVYKPRYNKEFFKRLNANTKHLEKHVERRCKNPTEILANVHLETFKEDSNKLIKLKDRLTSNAKSDNEKSKESLQNIVDQLEALEDRIMPLAIAIPNRCNNQVPDSDTVLHQIDSNFAVNENLVKVLSHTKLSYINNCYSKSIVGPNSHYYFGIGAKLQYGLADFFASQMERRDFVQTSGLCLTKSAVVEAANSKDLKNYANDPCRILTNNHQYTTLHLVEASREALLGFVSMLEPRASTEPLRLMTIGAGYRDGSLWFDSDEKRVAQFQTLHALILNSSIEPYSMKEFRETSQFIWDIYVKLGLPSRLVQCSLDSLLSNEYDAHRIDVWLPSRGEWIPVGRISHYLDYITIRSGMRRGHIIDATVYDGQALVAAIIENNQTSSGRFIIPSVIKNHMILLTEKEKLEYFRHNEVNPNNVHGSNVGRVLNNFEQRRYLVRRNYVFGHSKRAAANKQAYERRRVVKFSLALLVAFGIFIDWEEVYIQFVPVKLKQISYDFIYRPIRRFCWSLTYSTTVPKPEDLPYNKLDTSDYNLTEAERRQKHFKRYETKNQ